MGQTAVRAKRRVPLSRRLAPELLQRKVSGGAPRQGGTMMNTFQVYLTDQGGHCWFEPLMAESPAQLLGKLR